MDATTTLQTALQLLILPAIITYLTTRLLITHTAQTKLVGRDLHKHGQPKIPTLGGLATLAGITTPLTLAYFTTNQPQYLATATTLVSIATIGLLDDLYQLKQAKKVLLTPLGSTPLILLLLLVDVDTTILGYNLGLLYYPLIAIGITGAANATNMLAGFNGLETGITTIATISILISALITNNTQVTTIAIITLMAMLIFLHHNRYPAKIFPGNVGTLQMGAIIACMVILGKIEYVGPILVLPHLFDLTLKSRVRFATKNLGTASVNPNGTLSPPPYPSLPGFVMRKRVVTEPQLVGYLWLVEAICAGLATTLVYLARP